MWCRLDKDTVIDYETGQVLTLPVVYKNDEEVVGDYRDGWIGITKEDWSLFRLVVPTEMGDEKGFVLSGTYLGNGVVFYDGHIFSLYDLFLFTRPPVNVDRYVMWWHDRTELFSFRSNNDMKVLLSKSYMLKKKGR